MILYIVFDPIPIVRIHLLVVVQQLLLPSNRTISTRNVDISSSYPRRKGGNQKLWELFLGPMHDSQKISRSIATNSSSVFDEILQLRHHTPREPGMLITNQNASIFKTGRRRKAFLTGSEKKVVGCSSRVQPVGHESGIAPEMSSELCDIRKHLLTPNQISVTKVLLPEVGV